MATIYVDPTAKSFGTGSLSRPFKSWSQVIFKAGNSYLQKAGTSATATITVTTQATATAPIQIGSYGTGAAPVINGNISLNGASYVTISGLAVRNSSVAAIALQVGAHHNTISGNTLSQSKVGVWIGNGAGADNLIERNTISGSAINGIAVDKIANAAGRATRIVGNTVTGSGAHGIDINGNNFIVDGNTVNKNGLTISGASGIHVFGGFEGAPDTFGVGNTISNNVVYDDRDIFGPDGNGIQLDQYTNGNIVTANFTAGNDGAGIILYDSYNNTITNNMANGNQRDPGGTHFIKGDMVFAGSLDLTRGNFIAGNIALSTSGPAVLVDALTADNLNRFSGNIWQNTVGGPDTMVGNDTSWASWLAYDLTGGPGLTPDARTGITLALASYSGPLTYRYAAGTTQIIDGFNYTLTGWTGSQLVGTSVDQLVGAGEFVV